MCNLKCITFILLTMLFGSCEDIISLDLNDAAPRIVIEAEIINSSNHQQVRVSRTVALSDGVLSEPVSSAEVMVSDSRGRQVGFLESEPGVYTTERLRGVPGVTYTLQVTVDGEVYSGQSTMPNYVAIDSVSSSSGEFFGVSRKALHVHFQDPPEDDNYFGYRMSVDGSDFKNIGVFNDKFNNGRYVTHDLINMDIDIEVGDEVVIQRNQIDAQVYRYWYGVIQMLNPGSAAPSNPPSNLSGDALGYFSAQTTAVLRMVISDFPED